MDPAQPRSRLYHWAWTLQFQWSWLEIPQAVPLEHSFQTAELKRNKTAMTTASPTQVQQIVSEKKREQPQSQIRLWFVNYPQNSQLSRRTEGKRKHLHIYSCETLTFQQKQTHNNPWVFTILNPCSPLQQKLQIYNSTGKKPCVAM